MQRLNKNIAKRCLRFLNSLQIGDVLAFLDLMRDKKITIKKLNKQFKELGCKEPMLFARHLGKVWKLKRS
jgi:hypothetical protein